MSKKILIINGPNLNLLHIRDKNIYGEGSLQNIAQNCQDLANKLDVSLDFIQSNLEGEIVNLIQGAIDKYDGLIINAAGYTHTSVSIRDALELFKGVKIELHISNIFKREEFRQNSYISDVVDGVISGLGVVGYEVALNAITKMI